MARFAGSIAENCVCCCEARGHMTGIAEIVFHRGATDTPCPSVETLKILLRTDWANALELRRTGSAHHAEWPIYTRVNIEEKSGPPRFKIRRRKACQFESGRGHHLQRCLAQAAQSSHTAQTAKHLRQPAARRTETLAHAGTAMRALRVAAP